MQDGFFFTRRRNRKRKGEKDYYDYFIFPLFPSFLAKLSIITIMPINFMRGKDVSGERCNTGDNGAGHRSLCVDQWRLKGLIIDTINRRDDMKQVDACQLAQLGSNRCRKGVGTLLRNLRKKERENKHITG